MRGEYLVHLNQNMSISVTDIVHNYVKQLYCNENLILELLSKKLIIFLPLVLTLETTRPNTSRPLLKLTFILKILKS